MIDPRGNKGCFPLFNHWSGFRSWLIGLSLRPEKKSRHSCRTRHRLTSITERASACTAQRQLTFTREGCRWFLQTYEESVRWQPDEISSDGTPCPPPRLFWNFSFSSYSRSVLISSFASPHRCRFQHACHSFMHSCFTENSQLQRISECISLKHKRTQCRYMNGWKCAAVSCKYCFCTVRNRLFSAAATVLSVFLLIFPVGFKSIVAIALDALFSYWLDYFAFSQWNNFSYNMPNGCQIFLCVCNCSCGIWSWLIIAAVHQVLVFVSTHRVWKSAVFDSPRSFHPAPWMISKLVCFGL